jgi:hypothetical protein
MLPLIVSFNYFMLYINKTDTIFAEINQMYQINIQLLYCFELS